jgi:Uma2 family endonuclease
MATAQQLSTEQRFVLDCVDWKTYRAFLKALDERHVRVTYDRGTLELMTLSHSHEWSSSLLGQFVEVLTEELNMPRHSAGSTTFKRKRRKRGLEPDRSYYLGNEHKVRGKEEIDLRRDPPPDLALEVDISRSCLDRLGIYAALGVPEVWRFDGQTLQVHQLQADGKYAVCDRSMHFPYLPLTELVGFLQRRTLTDEMSLVRSFREWVREQIARGWPPPP